MSANDIDNQSSHAVSADTHSALLAEVEVFQHRERYLRIFKVPFE